MPVIKKKVWRVIDLINWADEYFSLKGFDKPRQEIEWMLTDILDCERFDLYLRFEEPLTSDQLELLHQEVDHNNQQEVILINRFHHLHLVGKFDLLHRFVVSLPNPYLRI